MYPAGAPGISVHRVSLDNGLSLRVIESGPPTGDVVLLVHGWGGCVYSFAETIPALAAAGYRAIAFDLPGHGLSDKPTDDSHYTTGALTDAVIGVANAMGVRRFTYLGHSMGGALGLELAMRREQRLERLVLVGPAGLGRVPLLIPLRLLSPAFVTQLWPRILSRRLVAVVLEFAFGTEARPTERDIDEYWAPMQFDEYAWACRACLHRLNWSPLSATELRSMRLPVLVITGGRERIVVVDESRARLMPAARVVPIPEGGHLVMQECSDRANAEILQFLRSSPQTLES